MKFNLETQLSPTWIGIDATRASTAKTILGSPPQRKSMSIIIWPFLRFWTRIPARINKFCMYYFFIYKRDSTVNTKIDRKGKEYKNSISWLFCSALLNNTDRHNP
jgi:hypothetical protein